MIHGVSIEDGKDGSEIFVFCPKNELFRDKAVKLGGEYCSTREAWMFDKRDIGKVKNFLVDYYGTDGTADCKRVTLEIEFTRRCNESGSLTLHGRPLVSAKGCYDNRGAEYNIITLELGVTIMAGRFRRSNRMMDPPVTTAEAGTVIRVRDVPEAIAELYVTEVDDCDEDGLAFKILDEPAVQHEALRAERKRLLNRLTEIDDVLGRAVEPPSVAM